MFKCSPEVVEQIDFKIYHLLNNLAREHPVAHGKIKQNKAETKYGQLKYAQSNTTTVNTTNMTRYPTWTITLT